MAGPLHPRSRRGAPPPGKTEPPKPDVIRPGPGFLVSRGRNGMTFDVDETASGGGILVGIIVDGLTARSGSYPNFAYGNGVIEILNSSGSGVARTAVAYNTRRDPIPASTEPALFGRTEDGKIFYITMDC